MKFMFAALIAVSTAAFPAAAESLTDNVTALAFSITPASQSSVTATVDARCGTFEESSAIRIMTGPCNGMILTVR